MIRLQDGHITFNPIHLNSPLLNNKLLLRVQISKYKTLHWPFKQLSKQLPQLTLVSFSTMGVSNFTLLTLY